MAARALRYASSDLTALALNDRHNFAMDYAISIFPINGIYSFIPKNACSSLRWSAAVANGCCSEDVMSIGSTSITEHFGPACIMLQTLVMPSLCLDARFVELPLLS